MSAVMLSEPQTPECEAPAAGPPPMVDRIRGLSSRQTARNIVNAVGGRNPKAAFRWLQANFDFCRIPGVTEADAELLVNWLQAWGYAVQGTSPVSAHMWVNSARLRKLRTEAEDLAATAELERAVANLQRQFGEPSLPLFRAAEIAVQP